MRQPPESLHRNQDLDLPAERSLRVTMLEFVAFLTLPIMIVVVASSFTSGFAFLSSRFVWREWWFLDVGRAFFADAGWFLTTVLAIVIALYVALLSQSPPNTPIATIWRTRARFARAGLALAAVTVSFSAACIAAAIASPILWPRFPLVAVATVAICLLGIGVGRFQTRSSEDRLATAEMILKIRVAQLRLLPPAPTPRAGRLRRPRPWLVIAVSFAAYVVVATVPAPVAALLDRMTADSSLELVGLALFVNSWWAVFGLLLPTALIRWSFTDPRPVRIAKNASAAFLTLALAGNAMTFVLIALSAYPDAAALNWGIVLISAPGVLFSALAVTSLFASRRLRRSPLFMFTLRFAVEESARRDAARTVAMLETEVADLQRLLSGPGRLRSVFAAIAESIRPERAVVPPR